MGAYNAVVQWASLISVPSYIYHRPASLSVCQQYCLGVLLRSRRGGGRREVISMRSGQIMDKDFFKYKNILVLSWFGEICILFHSGDLSWCSKKVAAALIFFTILPGLL